MTIEARDAGNVDDVVIEHQSKPTRYVQAKHAVDASTPVGAAWLMTGDTRSLLQRFSASWNDLRTLQGEPAMELVTDREIDPNDPIMRLLDRESELLVPAIEQPGPQSAVGKARREWAEHVGANENELVAMLGCLRFRTGRSIRSERERAADLMFGLGIEHDDSAVLRGIDAIRQWTRRRDRRLALDGVRALVDGVTTPITDPSAVLVVEAVDADPHPEDATRRLRWLDLFDGNDSMTRRTLRDPADWQRVIGPELEAAAIALEAMGFRSVLVRGPTRQAVLFGVGAALRDVKGFSLTYRQRGQLWNSEQAGFPQAVATESIDVGHGTDLAVVVSVATDALSAVVRYAEEAGLPLGRVASITPAAGVGDRSVSDGPSAVALASAIRDEARHQLEEAQTDRIHLFLAAPGGLALLLGHRWNALRPTVVYEHLGPGSGYTPTLTVSA